MLAIVLAADGASGSRLLDGERAPSMLPVAGRPTVAHTVSAAVEAGAEEAVLVVDEDGRVTAVTEKPAEATSRDADAGAYVFPMKARDWLAAPRSRRCEHELTDVLARVVAAFELTPVEVDRWIDASVPGRLLAAIEWKL